MVSFPFDSRVVTAPSTRRAFLGLRQLACEARQLWRSSFHVPLSWGRAGITVVHATAAARRFSRLRIDPELLSLVFFACLIAMTFLL